MTKNAWFMVAGRRANQWCRRAVIRHFARALRDWLRRIRNERGLLASKRDRTPQDCARQRQLNWLLGIGSVYRWTPAERAKQNRLATEILREKRQ